jgi:hypothetical protein
MDLIEGHRYRLPDGTLFRCTGVIYGISNAQPFTCEIAHTATTQPCGFTLESEDRRVRLTVNSDGSISRSDALPSKAVAPLRYGEWQRTNLRVDDLHEVQ